jgi:hypothetical protein
VNARVRSVGLRFVFRFMLFASSTIVLLALPGCAAPKPIIVDFSEVQREYRSIDYQEVYNRWTRHQVVRHEIADNALEAWATMKSWDYREAYVEHYAAIYNLSETDKSALRAAQLESSRDAYEFHVTAQSTNYKWNDLEKRSSAWKVTLVDGAGHELAPESVRLEKLPDPYEIEFFPAKGPFTRSYVIRFVKPAAADGKEPDFLGPRTGSLTLRIASPVGRLELIWLSI